MKLLVEGSVVWLQKEANERWLTNCDFLEILKSQTLQ